MLPKINGKDSETMNTVLGNALRYGVVISAIVIGLGTALLLSKYPLTDSSMYTRYFSKRIPHGNFEISLQSIGYGILSLNPFSMIELGFLMLLATPVARVFLSILLFALDGDRLYVYITAAVFAILVFSIVVTPFLPIFGG